MTHRPHYTPEQIAAALLSTRGNQRQAARILGCGATTIWNYIQRYPTVREAFDRACRARLEATGHPRARPLPRFEPEQVAEAIRESGGNLAAAARALGCGSATPRYYVKRYAIVRDALDRALDTRGKKSPGRRGPNPLYAPDRVAEALRETRGNLEAAGRLLGCNGGTVKDYVRRHPEVRAAYEQSLGTVIDSGRLPSGGCRPRYTPEQVAGAIRAAGGSQTLAARSLHSSKETVANYIERYAVVREALEEARARVLLAVENQLAQAVAAGKWEAVSFVLRTLGKDRGYTTERPSSPRLAREHDPLWIWIQAEYARRAAGEVPGATESTEATAGSDGDDG